MTDWREGGFMKSKSLLQPKGDQADMFLTGCFAWPLPQTLGSCHILSLQLLSERLCLKKRLSEREAFQKVTGNLMLQCNEVCELPVTQITVLMSCFSVINSCTESCWPLRWVVYAKWFHKMQIISFSVGQKTLHTWCTSCS